MGWREILNAPSQDLSDFSYKSPEDEGFSSFCNLNPEDLSEELRFEWVERVAIMEYNGGLPREEAERKALERIKQIHYGESK
jgi:hypothetical protein